MPRRKYTIKPTGVIGVSAQGSDLFTPSMYGLFNWTATTTTTENFTIKRSVARKRPGLGSHRNSATAVLAIAEYTEIDGTAHQVFVNTTDMCHEETGGANTYTYKTPTDDYDSKIVSITDAANSVVTFLAGTTISTDGAAPGDFFIIDDDHSSTQEHDVSWMAIQTVDSETQCTLVGNYETLGTSGSWSGSEKNGLIRKVFTAPTYKWSWAVVDDKFCFTHDGEHVWYWDGSGYAAPLDSTNATGYEFCIDYADRLVLARNASYPTRIQWSKPLDPTDWTDPTAGIANLIATGDGITGLGKIGTSLLVYSKNAIVFGNLTGIPTAPIAFPTIKRGIGCWAPWSIVDANGTNYFVGRSNFYRLDGMTPVAIGTPIAEEVFDNISEANLYYMWGVHDKLHNQIIWVDSTDAGNTQRAWAWNYIEQKWSFYRFVGGSDLSIGGHWTLSSEEEVMFGCETYLAIYSDAYKLDIATAIPCNWVIPVLDFTDQDPEAANRWKTVYKVRITYTDKTADTVLNLHYRLDGDDSFAAWGANTVGTADGRVKISDFDNVKSGNFFQFKLAESSTTKDVQIESIEIFYELGGEYYEI